MTLDPTLVQQLEQALPAYVKDRRWFRSKALNISGIKINHILEAGGFLILFLTIHYQEAAADLYLLPITSVKSPNAEQLQQPPVTTFESPEGELVFVYDAILSPFFRNVLFRTLVTSGHFESEGGKLFAKSSITLTQQEGVPEEGVPEQGIIESFVSKAEQSNTSIIYGHDFILKLFRKLESGINPDIEMGAFLTAQGFPNTPAVLATLEFQNAQGETFSAGILQRFVPNQGDAWKYTLNSLELFNQRAAHSPLDNPEILGDYKDSAVLLGVRTAQMHIALSSSTENPDFIPERFTENDAQALWHEIAGQSQTSFHLLRAKLSTLPPVEQDLAQKVIDLEPKLTQRFSALSAISSSAKRIRYHGDYHLGQLLYTGSDFMIIDFEGEPARPLIERRAKAMALRDVAGMLRSFQYAAYATATGTVETARFWVNHVSKLYLGAYLAQAQGHAFIPSTPEQLELFLNAFILQKALYEVQYELNNRPAWVAIPLRGILSLVEA